MIGANPVGMERVASLCCAECFIPMFQSIIFKKLVMHTKWLLFNLLSIFEGKLICCQKKTTCQHFNWMLQLQSKQVRINTAINSMHYWRYTCVTQEQRLVKIAHPSLPPSQLKCSSEGVINQDGRTSLVAGPLWWGGRDRARKEQSSPTFDLQWLVSLLAIKSSVCSQVLIFILE